MPPVAAKTLMTVGLLIASLWIGSWATQLIWGYGWNSSAQWSMFLFDTGAVWLCMMLSLWLVWSRRFTLRPEYAQHQFLLFVACALMLSVIALLPRIGIAIDYGSILDQGLNRIIPLGWFIGACWIAGAEPAGAINRRRSITHAFVRCSKCGYDMTRLTSATCPECGTAHTVGQIWRSGAESALSQRDWEEPADPARPG